MLTHLRSNAVAYLALCVALGGTSYAAVKLPKASVGAKQLKKNAVNSKKVRDGSLRPGDFKAGALPAGPQGEKGEPGTPGADGAQGPPGPVYGAAYMPAGGTPATTPDGAPASTYTFELPRAGKAYIQFLRPWWGRSCSDPEGGAYAALYVDGVGVPFSRVPLSSVSNPRPVNLTATLDLAAGSHTATIREDCVLGTLTGLDAVGRDSWTVLLLGS